MNTTLLISILLVAALSVILVVTGLKKQPALGILAVVLVISFMMLFRGGGLTFLGLHPPASWKNTILLGLGVGFMIQLVSIALLEPLLERWLRTPHDYSMLNSLKGNPAALVQWLLVAWILVAFLEEIVFRGFLTLELVTILGDSPLSLAANILFTSTVFGLAHGYQGRSGIISTGLVGVLLALLFVWNGFNLWLPILTHGFIDTIGLTLIAVDGEKKIRRRLWGENG